MVSLDFSGTLVRWPVFAHAALVTMGLSAIAMAVGLLIGSLGASAKLSRNRVLRAIGTGYVELFRNTPFLVQIYLIYFGLPSLGIRINPMPAGILSLSLYSGAYLTEIIRAGIQSIEPGQVEAARSLGLSPFRTFRHVVLKPSLAAVYPSLTSQFILTMLASSIVSTISIPELTGAANDIQGLTFRSLEAYLVVAAIYIAMTGVFKGGFALLGRSAFAFQIAAR
jgi:polar amino acid transport system permease protein